MALQPLEGFGNGAIRYAVDAWAAHNEAKAVFVEKIRALMALV